MFKLSIALLAGACVFFTNTLAQTDLTSIATTSAALPTVTSTQVAAEATAATAFSPPLIASLTVNTASAPATVTCPSFLTSCSLDNTILCIQSDVLSCNTAEKVVFPKQFSSVCNGVCYDSSLSKCTNNVITPLATATVTTA